MEDNVLSEDVQALLATTVARVRAVIAEVVHELPWLTPEAALDRLIANFSYAKDIAIAKECNDPDEFQLVYGVVSVAFEIVRKSLSN